MANQKNPVLILGADDRSTLTVIRSLGRKGVIVHLGCDKKHSVCRFSKYTHKTINFPEANIYQKEWLRQLEEVVKTTNYDLVIPTADDYLVLIVKNRQILEKYSKFAVPDEKGFTYTYDKNRTFELAQKLSIPIPKTFLINNINDIKIIKDKISYPAVIKPTSSKVWKDGKRYSLTVEYAFNAIELNRKIRTFLRLCPVLIQNFHKGVGVGIELLLNRGRLVAAFQHERIHEPLGGGGSSYRKSVPLAPDLLDYSLQIMGELQWTGVAMVEYKYDRESNSSVLMEINGRFWGSLPLAVNSGVNFPACLYDMLVNNKITPLPEYKKNIYCRNIVKDIEWFRNNLKADKKNPLIITVPLHSILLEFTHIITLREYFDTLVLDDIFPGIVNIFSYFKEKYSGLKNKIKKKMLIFNHTNNSIKVNTQKRKLKNKLQFSNASILFVCKGNICRSAFAEYYFKHKLKKENCRYIKIKSVGFIKKENRSSPDQAIEAADYFNINLRNHRSKTLTQIDVANFNIIFVMDADLYLTMLQRYPDSKTKLFFLGGIGAFKPVNIEIQDPYGGSLNDFKSNFSSIMKSIDNLFEYINKQNASS